jgi:uncharacterized membrane protein YqgA involved in biofilm formation
MRGLSTIINTATVVAGGLVGSGVGRQGPERMKRGTV